MRPRHEIREQLICIGDGSVKDSVEAGNELVVELLLDIRELLQRSDDRIANMIEEGKTAQRRAKGE